MVSISLQLPEKTFTAGGLEDQEGNSRGIALAVPSARGPAELTLHEAGTSRPSKARFRIACRNMPQRARLLCTVDST